MVVVNFGTGDDPRAAPRVSLQLSFPAAPEVVPWLMEAMRTSSAVLLTYQGAEHDRPIGDDQSERRCALGHDYLPV